VICQDLPERPRSLHERRIRSQERGTFRYFGAWLDGTAVGHVGLAFPDDRRIDALLEWRGRAHVEDLWVMPRCRRLGIGLALMLDLEAAGRAADLREIALDTGTSPGYAAARRLYRRLGYVERPEPYIISAAPPPDADPVSWCDVVTMWTKEL
jgi:ribosomal protein S18 acetylase RimI-like enzyme